MSNPETSTDLSLPSTISHPLSLDEAANDSDWVVRMAVAMHANTLPRTLAVLATDPNREVAAAATLRGIDCPASTLEALADSKHPKIRQLVALHPSVPLHVLDELANDESADVRLGVASNPIAPLELVEALTGDEEILVCLAAFMNQGKRNALREDDLDALSLDEAYDRLQLGPADTE